MHLHGLYAGGSTPRDQCLAYRWEWYYVSQVWLSALGVLLVGYPKALMGGAVTQLQEQG
jgi:hypothetical protein